MDSSQVIEIGVRAMWVALELSMPVLAVSLGVGLLVSILQAVTQLQEPTLTFIPKLLATVLVLVFAGPWMLETLVSFTTEILGGISTVGARSP